MTRINSGVGPQFLTDEHLLSEHREIKRVCQVYQRRIDSGIPLEKGVPQTFCLNTGHVLFFMVRPTYTLHRYKRLYSECINRGFNVTDYSRNWELYKQPYDVPNPFYVPTFWDTMEIILRIKSNVITSPQAVFHHYGKPLTKGEVILLLFQATRWILTDPMVRHITKGCKF